MELRLTFPIRLHGMILGKHRDNFTLRFTKLLSLDGPSRKPFINQ
jgi:hypothetical protein